MASTAITKPDNTALIVGWLYANPGWHQASTVQRALPAVPYVASTLWRVSRDSHGRVRRWRVKANGTGSAFYASGWRDEPAMILPKR